jgi:hypothetical protein
MKRRTMASASGPGGEHHLRYGMVVGGGRIRGPRPCPDIGAGRAGGDHVADHAGGVLALMGQRCAPGDIAGRVEPAAGDGVHQPGVVHVERIAGEQPERLHPELVGGRPAPGGHNINVSCVTR